MLELVEIAGHGGFDLKAAVFGTFDRFTLAERERPRVTLATRPDLADTGQQIALDLRVVLVAALKSSSVISPISRCISAASSCSRSAVSSFISASAVVTRVSTAHWMPEIINESSRNMSSAARRARA